MTIRTRAPGKRTFTMSTEAFNQLVADRLKKRMLREVVTYQLGYVVAVIIGAGALQLSGWWGAALVAAFYGIETWRAYEHYKKFEATRRAGQTTE